jgi:hypothetical protein
MSDFAAPYIEKGYELKAIGDEEVLVKDGHYVFFPKVKRFLTNCGRKRAAKTKRKKEEKKKRKTKNNYYFSPRLLFLGLSPKKSVSFLICDMVPGCNGGFFSL